jgi:glutamate/tyrosine decarboxylase-like PLP-dependent enzyme
VSYPWRNGGKKRRRTHANKSGGPEMAADEVIAWAQRANAWVHVDGAFGLWALTEYALLAKGFRRANSWATDAHKWLNVPYDSGIAIVLDPEALGRAMSISGSYLPTSDYRDAMKFTPDSSRRARALEIWSALKFLGRAGLSDLVGRTCRYARKIAESMKRDGIEVLNEIVLNQVVVAFGDNERTKRVIASIQASGACWCGGTVWKGRAVMRISVSSWATTDRDIERLITAILEAHRAC